REHWLWHILFQSALHRGSDLTFFSGAGRRQVQPFQSALHRGSDLTSALEAWYERLQQVSIRSSSRKRSHQQPAGIVYVMLNCFNPLFIAEAISPGKHGSNKPLCTRFNPLFIAEAISPVTDLRPSFTAVGIP